MAEKSDECRAGVVKPRISPMGGARGSHCRGGSFRGQATAEFGQVAVLLMLVMFAVVEFGVALNDYDSVCYAAKAASRWGAVNGQSVPTPASTSSITNFVKANVPGLDNTKVTVTPSWSPDEKPGSVVQVQVEYDFPLLPFVSNATLKLQSTSSMVISQ